MKPNFMSQEWRDGSERQSASLTSNRRALKWLTHPWWTHAGIRLHSDALWNEPMGTFRRREARNGAAIAVRDQGQIAWAAATTRVSLARSSASVRGFPGHLRVKTAVRADPQAVDLNEARRFIGSQRVGANSVGGLPLIRPRTTPLFLTKRMWSSPRRGRDGADRD